MTRSTSDRFVYTLATNGSRRSSGPGWKAHFTQLVLIGIASGLLIAAESGAAATLRWTGGHPTGAYWSQGANWDTATAPADGDTIVFPSTAARKMNTNDIPDLNLTAIRFSGTGAGFGLYGISVLVTNSITATNDAGINGIALNRITLGRDLPFTVAQNGATLLIDSDVRLNGFNLTCNTAGALGLGGAISGNGGIIKTDIGTLTLAGAAGNTFTGDVFVYEGLLEMDKTSGLAVPTRLVIGDGVGGAQADRARNLADDQVDEVTVNASGLWELAGHIETVSDLVLNEGGDVQTGAAGNLRLGNGADVTVTPSGLPIPDASRISGKLELLSGMHRFDIGEGSTLPSDATELVIDADITGVGGITLQTDSGDMLLSGNNSFEGEVNVNGGELRISSNTALGSTLAGTTVNNDATLWLQGNVLVLENLTLNSTGRTGFNGRPALEASGPGNNCAGTVTFQSNSRIGVTPTGFLDLSFSMSGLGSLIKEDEGTLRLSALNLSGFAGNIFINAGVFELNHGFIPATIPANLGVIVVGDDEGGPHADVLRNLSSAQVGIDIPFVGPYAWPVIVNGSGLWDLNGFADQTSLLTLHNGGDVTTGPNGIIAVLIGLLADPGPAPDNDPARISGNLQIRTPLLPVAVQEGDNSSGDAADLIINARVSGGGFFKSGTGDLLLSGDNVFSGPITVNNGELRAGHTNALGTGTDLVTVVSNATLWLQGDVQVTNRPLRLDSTGQTGAFGNDAALKISGTNIWDGDVELRQDARIGISTDGILDLSGVISGTGGVIKEGPGLLIYSGAAENTYTGTTVVNEGQLDLKKAGSHVAVPSALIIGDDNGGANADIVRCINPSELGSLSAVTVNSSGQLIVRTEIIGSLSGRGNVVINSFLTAGDANTSTTFDGVISGAGGLKKSGTGTWTLNGNNTHTDGTFAAAGKLLINGQQPGFVLVWATGTLGGTGRVGAVSTVVGGATISPGSSPGELQTGNLILDPDVRYRVELNGPVPGTDYDRLKVNGTVDLAGARLDLSLGFVPAVGHLFTIIDNDGADTVSGTFDGLPEGATLEAGSTRLSVSYRGGADSNDVMLLVLAPPPPCPEPVVLSIHRLTNAVELSWPSCPSNFYQLAWTTNFQQWEPLTPPLAAPETNSVMIWTTPTSLPYQFFQLVVRPLTNSPVPTNSGIYAGRTLTHDGITRTYRLNIPESYTNGMPAPLMLALHGHNQTADSFAGNVPDLATYANNAGVILVFPAGTTDQRGTGWNILDPTPDNPVDDVGFLLALIDELDATLNIDRKRVYAGGFSNGGQMCHRLAARTTNVFAAFAAVGSAVAGEFGTGTLVYQAPPLEPNSILIVNSTNDCKRPYWGGLNDDGTLQPPARDSLTHWTNADLCTPPPILTTNVFVTNHIHRVFADCGAPYPPFNDPRTNLVIREHYQFTCTPGTEVLFVTLTDGGHAWVERADNVGFDTSREVIEFFLRHCRCDAMAASEPLVIPTAPGRYERTLCDQGYSRLFRLQIPAGYNPAVAAPLVFVFHGGGGTVSSFSASHPALFTKCDTEGLILVLPQALPNPLVGETLWSDKPFDVVVDDVAFVTNLLEHFDAALNVDRLRVYAAGFSSGGDFSHWLGSTTIGLLAAIAPVCHTMGWVDRSTGALITPPPPLEPMSVLMVRGGLDPRRPFNGSATSFSAQDDMAYWVNGSGCAGAPVVTSAPGLMQWQNAACAGTTEVILVRVDNMGHEWPDGPPYNANVQVIDFLLTHSR